MGRPTDSPKNTLIQIRMDNESVDKLNYLVEKKNSTRSEIIRDGIAQMYDNEKK